MLLIRNGLWQFVVLPPLDIVVCLDGTHEVFLIFSISSLLDSFKIVHHKGLFSFGDAWTVPVWRVHVEFVDVVVLSESHLGKLLSIDRLKDSRG